MNISHNLGISRKIFAVSMAFFAAIAVLVSTPVSAQTIVTAGFAGKVVLVDPGSNSLRAEVRAVYSGASQSGVGTILPPGKVVTVNVPIGTKVLDAQGNPISLLSVAPGMYFNARVNIDTATGAVTATLIRFGTAQTPPPIPPQPPLPSTTVTAGFSGKVTSVDLASNSFNAEVRAVYAGGGYAGIGTILPPGKIVKVNIPSGVRLLDFYGNPMTLSQAQVGQYFNARVNVDRVTGAITAALIRFGTAVAPPELPPTIVVISPNGGEQWPIGSTQTIRWKSSPNIPTVDIQLQNWFGACVPSELGCPVPPSYQLAKNIPNTGYYSWVVGSVPPNNVSTGQYTVTVNQYNNFAVSDTSDGPFSIVPAGPFYSVRPAGPFILGQTYDFFGYVSGGVPNALVYFFLQRPDGTMKYDESNDILAKAPTHYTDVRGNYSASATQTIASEAQTGIYTSWVTVAGVKSNKMTHLVQSSSNGPIKVTVPNGGEVWQLNSLHTIQWTPYDPQNGVNVVPTVSAYLEKLENGNFTTVGKIIESGKASIHWIGELDNYGNYAQPGDYYVRVVNSQTNQWDRSDGSFKLVPQNTVKADLKINGSDGPIALPAGGGKVTFSWTSQNADSCKLYLNGLSDDLYNLPPSGQKDIFLKQNPYPAQLATALACSSSIGDATDTVFISPYTGQGSYISITSPNGGENISLTATYPIGWVYSPDIVKVSIALYKNDAFFKWIVADLPWSGPGLLSWNPSSTVSASEIGGQVFKIYMIGYKSGGGTVEDKSDAPFSIVSGVTYPPIQVLVPNGGETWTKGTMQTIQWRDNTPIPECPVGARCTPPAPAPPKYYDLKLAPFYPPPPPCSSSPCPTYLVQMPYTIANSVRGSSYNWEVGAIYGSSVPPDGSYTVQVCQSGTNICDSSDSYFKIMAGTPSVSEQVKCVFNNSTTEQQCYSTDGQYKFSGIGTAGGTVTGPLGTQITWKSSCGGYAYTTMDGNNEYANFYCGIGNLPPVISGVSGPTVLQAGETGTWTVTASDPENGSLSYSVVWGDVPTAIPQCPPNEKCIKTAVPMQQSATFTHSYAFAGTYTPVFTVSDNAGLSAKTSISVDVKGTSSNNNPPRITVFPPDPGQINVGQQVTFSWQATDPDNDNLYWSIDWGDGGVGSLCPSPLPPPAGQGWVFTNSHAWNSPGTYMVKATVFDCKGGNYDHAFNVNVVQVPVPNASPVINSWSYVPSQIRAGEPVQFNFYGSDADNDNLSWSINWGDRTALKDECPSSLLNNAFFANHTWQNGGNYTITMGVTDCKGAYDTKSFTVNVSAGTPAVKVFFPNGTEMLGIGSTYNIQWKTYNLGTAKRNININLLNSQSVLVLPLFVGAYDDGVESWTIPTSLNPGTYKIRVSACVLSGCYSDESDGVFNLVFGIGSVPASTGTASILESIQQQLNDIAKIVNSLGM